MTAFDAGPGFIRLDDVRLFEWTNGVVVVPSRRLKDALIETVDLRARRAGRECWTNVRVRTNDELLLDLYESALAAGHAPARRVLSGEALRFATLRATADADTNLPGLFESGWQLVQEFELGAEVAGFDDHEGSRAWRAWAQEFRDQSARVGWVTLPELPALLSSVYRREPRAAPNAPMAWLGFEHVAPSWRQLRAALAAAGGQQTEVQLTASYRSTPRRVAAADTADELRRAIRWAHEWLHDTTGLCHVGIVVPDLVERYDVVLNELAAVFGAAPSDGRDVPYNLSGGLPLIALPVCADALDLLRWCFFAESPATVGRVLASPFLALDTGAAMSRAATLPSRYDLARFVMTTRHAATRVIEQRVRRWHNPQSFGAWIDEFRQTLCAAGWPGTTVLKSESFQAVHTFEALCEELAAAGDLVGTCSGSTALELVAAAATRRPFAPQRGWAPVQVLGLLESAGLAFSHLWVTGLSANTWPAAPRVHPLIPRRWQTTRGVPRVTVKEETAFARRMIDGWAAAAPQVVFSHPQQDDGEPARASALLPIASAHEVYVEYRTSPAALRRGDVLEPDTPEAVPVSDVEHTVLGAAAVRDQSLCPFRAFAVHRLGAELSRGPSSFPPADERGTTLHAALQLLYRDLHSRSELAALPSERRTALVARAVDAALSPSLRRRAPDAFVETERERLIDLMLNWIEVDLRRPEFLCESQESVHEFELAGARVRVRIDRIDRDVATNDAIVLDYKSGVVSPNHWQGSRPEDPQLPLYAAIVPGVREVAFAELRTAACRLNGVTADPARYPSPSPGIRMQNPNNWGADDWPTLVIRWRAIAESLVAEFRRGVVIVDPLHAGVCRRCHLQTLCRIGDRDGIEDE